MKLQEVIGAQQKAGACFAPGIPLPVFALQFFLGKGKHETGNVNDDDAIVQLGFTGRVSEVCIAKAHHCGVGVDLLCLLLNR